MLEMMTSARQMCESMLYMSIFASSDSQKYKKGFWLTQMPMHNNVQIPAVCPTLCHFKRSDKQLVDTSTDV